MNDTDRDEDAAGALVPGELERLIAGTFVLMTSWYQCPQTAICHKLLDNLARIARHEAVSDSLRRVCLNAGARWAAYLEEIELAIEAGGDEEDEDCDEPATVALEPPAGPVTLH